MRVIEISFFAGTFLICHFGFGLSGIAAYVCAFVAAIILRQVAKLRHCEAFRISLEPGTVIRLFEEPAIFGNPIPYSWFRYRRWYSAVVVGVDGSESQYNVMIEGTCFGLFRIGVVRQAMSDEEAV